MSNTLILLYVGGKPWAFDGYICILVSDAPDTQYALYGD